MDSDDPKPASDDKHETPPTTRDAFDLGQLQSLNEDEADAEWLRYPEAWHLH